eukprot:1395542-Amorphochlora_amoeboformis.AAC.3
MEKWKKEESEKQRLHKSRIDALKHERELQLKERECMREKMLQEKAEYEKQMIEEYRKHEESEKKKAKEAKEHRFKMYQNVMKDNERRRFNKLKQKV